MDNLQSQNSDENSVQIEQRYIPPKYRTGKKPVLAAFMSFLIMLAFLGIQIVVIVPFMVGELFSEAASSDNSFSGLSQEEIVNAMMGKIDTIGLTLLATFISLVAAVLWYRFGYCRNYHKEDLKKSCKKIFTKKSLLGIFLSAVCLFYFCDFIVLLIELIDPSAIEEYSKLIESSGIETLDWRVIILTVVMAPINEECIMRGIIFTKLKRNMAPVYAILISALYFGIFHMQLVQSIYAAVLGIFMAYIAFKYESIIASMVFHALFNGMNYILLLLPAPFSENTGLKIIIPLITGILWYLIDGKRKIEDID